uniref:Protocadherin 2 alpha a 1 n=1 Tax=Scleropages formosus TaxID=113540 RepID=A0A8D0CJ22_SCLFO
MSDCGHAIWDIRYFSRDLIFFSFYFSATVLLWNIKPGTFVGNIAGDLGIQPKTLLDRRFRMVSADKSELFQVNEKDGALLVSGRIDREELCQENPDCYINLKAVIEDPLEIHHVAIEIVDVNDHSPNFADRQRRLEIPESTVPGTRFQLAGAHDPDVGINALRSYKISRNEHFELKVEDRSENNKIPVLVLLKPLDRERTAVHELLLTALDGGNPPLSGLVNISIVVLDINDNVPVFDQQKYSVSLQENLPIGTVIIKVNATDLDFGDNGVVEYSFGETVRGRGSELFELDRNSGEIRVKGLIDFEEKRSYEIHVQATDNGPVPLSGHCDIFVRVEDVNDNQPEIEVTFLLNSIPEDAKLGTVVALIGVTDKDSGLNGQVTCTLEEDFPFELKPSSQSNFYSVVTNAYLDRETVPEYVIKIMARDLGSPALLTSESVTILVTDVNDNRPTFSENPYTMYLAENNVPGVSIFSVSAVDSDENENAQVSYVIGKGLNNTKLASFLNVNPENGNIYALKSFDFEREKTFQFQVVAKDSGTPSLSSNVTVNMFILDQNDNAPVILSPVNSNGSTEFVEEFPRNVIAGHLVTKVRAFDPDIGYNGWLSFSLLQVTDPTLFGLERYTGQIRTLRPFMESDKAEHKLVVLVKDNGNVSLSATATVIIRATESKEAFAVSDVKSAVKNEKENSVTFYLIISLGSVSVLFFISIIILTVMQCSKPRDYSSKYSRDSNYVDTSGNGTLCHSIQYRSGEKRYMLVGPRMSIGSTIVPNSNGNTLVVSEHSGRTCGAVSTIQNVGALDRNTHPEFSTIALC